MTRPYSETKKIMLITAVVLTIIVLVKKFVFHIDTEGRPAGYSQRNDGVTLMVIGIVSYLVGAISNRLKLPKYRKGLSGLSVKLSHHRLFSPIMTVGTAIGAVWLSFMLYGRLVDERLALFPLAVWTVTMLIVKRKRKSPAFDGQQEITRLHELQLIPDGGQVKALFQVKPINEMKEGEHITILTNQHVWRIEVTEGGWEVKVCLPLAAIERLKHVSGDTHWLAFAKQDEQEVYLDFALSAHPFVSKRELKQRYKEFLVALYHQLDRQH